MKGCKTCEGWGGEQHGHTTGQQSVDMYRPLTTTHTNTYTTNMPDSIYFVFGMFPNFLEINESNNSFTKQTFYGYTSS